MSEDLKGMFRRLLFGSRKPSPERLRELRSQLTNEQEIRRLILEEGKLQAIRAFRQQTDAPLRDSMETVDEMAQEMLEGSPPAS